MIAKKIIAHRGFHDIYHENTIGAFMRAIDSGADFIEFDIRKTVDNKLIAFHDPVLLFDQKEFPIDQCSYSELHVLAKKQNIEIPTVKNIFEVCAGQLGFDIEFKVDQCVDETMEYIRTFECSDDCFVTSFKESIVTEMAEKFATIPCGLLTENIDDLSQMQLDNISILCPSAETFDTHRDLLTSWKISGKTIAIWTVDTAESLRNYLTDPLVDSIITNKTDLAVTLRNTVSKWSNHGSTT
ncbi:MAG: glycerophosphodiester phosphodiesterase [Fibrobacterota bacterium]